MNNKLNGTTEPKNFVLELITTIIKKCEEDIQSYMASIEEDFLHYFTVKAKSHVICVMMKQQFTDLRSWVEAEEEDAKIIELLESGISFMTKQLLGYRRLQSTNELHNLKEEYKLEMYSTLIPTYQQIINRTKSLMIQSDL